MPCSPSTAGGRSRTATWMRSPLLGVAARTPPGTSRVAEPPPPPPTRALSRRPLAPPLRWCCGRVARGGLGRVAGEDSASLPSPPAAGCGGSTPEPIPSRAEPSCCCCCCCCDCAVGRPIAERPGRIGGVAAYGVAASAGGIPPPPAAISARSSSCSSTSHADGGAPPSRPSSAPADHSTRARAAASRPLPPPSRGAGSTTTDAPCRATAAEGRCDVARAILRSSSAIESSLSTVTGRDDDA